jgi:hypothetical protein
MKISPLCQNLKNVASELKRFYLNESVNIVESYGKDSVSTALYDLSLVKDVFVSYAKSKSVYLSIDRASSVISDKSKISSKLKDKLDKSIVLTVVNKLTGKTDNAIVDTTKDLFVHSGVKKIVLKDEYGLSEIIQVKYSHEDNFIRKVYRTFEYLTAQVNKK